MTKSTHAFAARFRAIARERIAKVRASLDAGDADEARRELHGLKGEARVVGFEAVAKLAHALEEMLEQGVERARIDHHIAQVEDELEADPASAPTTRLEAAPVERQEAPGLESLSAVAKRAAESFLRVDLQQLTRVTRAIGELRTTDGDLTRLIAALEELAETSRDESARRARSALALAHQLVFDHRQRCDAITDALRRLRMVPLHELLDPFPRAVAQLATQLGKEVEVVVSGADIEIDRQVLEVVTEPLLHLVRNAVDHGIEAPDERRARGKPATGRIWLRARASGGTARIEVADDGGGVDVEAVRRAAGVDTIEGDEQLLAILSRHGLSTRDEVSEVSGRGVGLDVVKRRVEAVGGRIELATRRGHGTTFAIELPTSMVLGAMVCLEVEGLALALPPYELDRVVDGSTITIEHAGRGLAVRVDDRFIPFVDLGVLIERCTEPRPRARVLILRHGERMLAVGVDAFAGTRPVSEQRLDPFLEGLAIVRSVAVLAGGELAVVLDTAEIVRRADRHHGVRRAQPSGEAATPAQVRRVLVVDDSELTRDLVVSALRELGLEVVEAVDGARALEELERTEVSLVVTDLDMPVLDGFELIRRVRASRTARLPIIVLSTRGSDADIERASTLGADAYLVKSRLELDQLRRVVRRYVEVP